jgi:hypothetical protein
VRDTQPVAGANLGHGGGADEREEAARLQVT